MQAEDSNAQPADAATTIPTEGRVLAIDPGEKRIGLAMSDPSQTIAQPLDTLTRRAGQRFPLQALKFFLDEHCPVGLVVGLPIAPDGTEDERAAAARSVGELVASKANLPVEFWDERMTTARVLSAVRDLGGGTKGKKEDIDSLAATVLLQHFLDSRR